MSVPVLLATPKVEANEALVRELKEILGEAEAGNLESICFVAWKYNGNVQVYQFTDDITRKVGALTRMIHDLLKA